MRKLSILHWQSPCGHQARSLQPSASHARWLGRLWRRPHLHTVVYNDSQGHVAGWTAVLAGQLAGA